MPRNLTAQTVLHLPSLFFILTLVVVALMLSQEDILPPIPTETVASDIVWSRHTAEGEVIALQASHLRQQENGRIEIQEIALTSHDKENSLHLYGSEGITDNTYEKIRLANVSGELNANNETVTLSLMSAVYHLNNHHLQGEQVTIEKNNQKLAGDNFVWDNEKIIIKGNVQAVIP